MRRCQVFILEHEPIVLGQQNSFNQITFILRVSTRWKLIFTLVCQTLTVPFFPPCAAKQSHCSSNHPNLADHLLKNAPFWLLSERRDWKRLTGNCRIGMWGHVPKLGSFETVRFKLLISGEKMCLTVPSSLFILPVVKCWSSTQCWGGFENPVDAFKLRSGEMGLKQKCHLSWGHKCHPNNSLLITPAVLWAVALGCSAANQPTRC